MGQRDGDFQLGDWTVQPGLNRLRRGTTDIQLEPKVMQVLLELARNAGRPVTRDQLLDRVWPGTYVHEDVLSRSISELRKVLGDSAAEPQFIETIRKVGYRLMVPVEPFEAMEKPPSIRAKRAGMGLASIAAVLLAAAGLVALDALRSNDNPPLKPLRAVPLTTLPGREIDPAFSPDGRQLAYAWQSTTQGHFDIYVQLLGSGSALRLTEHPGDDISPAFSPDGGQLAFVRQQEGGCAIYVMPAMGGPERMLTECTSSSALFPKWSPDGRFLLYSESTPPTGSRCVRLLSTQTLQASRPVSCTDEVDDLYPVFSPDGSLIAFVRSQGGHWQLLLAPSDGSSPPRILSSLTGKTLDLEWSPDGDKLVVVSDDGNGFGLWTVPAQGGEPSWIPAGNGSVTDIALASNRLAFSDSLDDENIWRMDLPPLAEAKQSIHALIVSSRWDSKPRLSPDGRHIAFQSTRSGEHGIWVSDSDGSHPFQVTSLPDCVTRDPEWTADGQRILFATAMEGQSEIYSVGAQGGQPQRLTFHPSHDLDPQGSPDGSIYFRSKRSGSWEIWRLSESEGHPEQVSQGASVAFFSVQPEGKIYLSRIGQPGLWRLDEPASFTLLLNGLNSFDNRNWTVSQEGIYFVQRTDFSQPQLSFYDFATQQSEISAPLEAISNKSGLSVSPQGNYLLYSRVDLQESDILLLENF